MFRALSNLPYYSYHTLTKQQIIPLIQLLLSPKQTSSVNIHTILFLAQLSNWTPYYKNRLDGNDI